MEPIGIAVSDKDSIIADCLSLAPDRDQWQAWSTLRRRDKVSFRTKLCNAGIFPCVIAWTTTAPPGVGSHWLMVNTCGAELIQKIAVSSPPARNEVSGSGQTRTSAGRCLRCNWTGSLNIEQNKVYISTEGLTAAEKNEILEMMTEYVLVDSKRDIVAKTFCP